MGRTSYPAQVGCLPNAAEANGPLNSQDSELRRHQALASPATQGIATSFELAGRIFLSVTISTPTGDRRLVYQSASPLRNPLAGPATVGRPFSMGRSEVLACGDRCSGVSRSGATLNRPSRPKSDLQREKVAETAWIGNIQGRACARNSFASRRRRRDPRSAPSHRKCRRERRRASRPAWKRRLVSTYEPTDPRRRGNRRR